MRLDGDRGVGVDRQQVLGAVDLFLPEPLNKIPLQSRLGVARHPGSASESDTSGRLVSLALRILVATCLLPLVVMIAAVSFAAILFCRTVGAAQWTTVHILGVFSPPVSWRPEVHDPARPDPEVAPAPMEDASSSDLENV